MYDCTSSLQPTELDSIDVLLLLNPCTVEHLEMQTYLERVPFSLSMLSTDMDATPLPRHRISFCLIHLH